MPFHFEELPSTQTFLKEHVLTSSLEHLDYALSDSQTEGLGRQGRPWISEKGNLFLSIWIKDFNLPLTWIPHWMGVAVIHSLKALGIPDNSLKLKWPNDLVISDTKKAAGILCEKVGSGIVAGIGVNLITAPEVSDRETGSMKQLIPEMDFTGMNVKLTEKIIHFLKREPGVAALREQYQAYSLLRSGRELHWVDLQTQTKGSGYFIRYGEFGELLVKENGKERALYSEEIKIS